MCYNDSMKNSLVTLDAVTKHFDTKDGPLAILKDVSLTVGRGEKIAIVGPSGSGKSTLLSLIGLLDDPTTGNLFLEEKSALEFSESARAKLRNQLIGFVFQSFELIQSFTVRENISTPLEINGEPFDPKQVDDLLEEVGLTQRADAMPSTLSGGERQRVAIARALANNPKLILADEPTGSLDQATGEKVLQLLLRAVNERGTSLIVITHDDLVASYMDRVYEIKDGTLYARP